MPFTLKTSSHVESIPYLVCVRIVKTTYGDRLMANSKFTEEEDNFIISSYNKGITTKVIAAKLGKSKSSICGRLYRLREKATALKQERPTIEDVNIVDVVPVIKPLAKDPSVPRLFSFEEESSRGAKGCIMWSEISC